MFEDFMNVQPDDWKKGAFESEALAANIKILGVGGGGGNAVATIYNFNYNQYDGEQIKCGYFICNTDKQALESTNVPNKILLGDGLGAGCNQAEGRDKAINSLESLRPILNIETTKVLFLAAGMGGGTGTGATPIIASEAKKAGILTIAVVTMPFEHEGDRKYSAAVDGVLTLKDCVDCLILVDNNKLYGEEYADQLFNAAFPHIDQILATAVLGIAHTITRKGLINIDLRDTKNLLTDGGLTIVGHGSGTGVNRIEDAVEKAFNTSLLMDLKTQTASDILWNLTVPKSDKGITMREHQKLSDLINERTGKALVFKEGIVYDPDESRDDRIDLTIIATGIDMSHLDVLINKDKTTFIDIDESFVFTDKMARDEKNEKLKSSKKKKGNTTGNITTGGTRVIANQGPKFHFNEAPILTTTDQELIKEYSKKPAFFREKDYE